MVDLAAPTPAESGRWLSFRLHDPAAARMGAPRRNLIIATGVVLTLLVLGTTMKSWLAVTFPRATLAFAPGDPVALLTAARQDFTATTADIGRSEVLPDERSLTASRRSTAATSKATVPLNQIAAMAKRALRADPLSAGGFDLLSSVATAQDNGPQALDYAKEARRLSLHETATNLTLAAQAAKEGDYPQALAHLDVQLRSSLGMIDRIVPLVLQVAEHPEGLKALVGMLGDAPPWRDLFMTRMPQAMSNTMTPLELFLGLAKTERPTTRADIALYLDELVRRREFQAARYAWLQLLPPGEMEKVGLLTNGSFETVPSGGPFDWHIKRGGGVLAEISPQRDNPRERALMLQFGSGRTSFEVLQYVMLPPGTYNFQASVRGDLSGRRGLVWRLTCVPDGRRLGETPMFMGTSDPWVETRAVFKVPPDCATQILALVLDARSPSEQMAAGTVWYDNVKLARDEAADIPPPPQPPRPARVRN